MGKEGLYSSINNTPENLPQITANTDALVIVGVKFVSILIDWGYQSPVPGFRKAASLKNQVKEF